MCLNWYEQVNHQPNRRKRKTFPYVSLYSGGWVGHKVCDIMGKPKLFVQPNRMNSRNNHNLPSFIDFKISRWMCDLKHLHSLKVSPQKTLNNYKGKITHTVGNHARYHLKQVIEFEIISRGNQPHHIPSDAMKDTPLLLRYSLPHI